MIYALVFIINLLNKLTFVEILHSINTVKFHLSDLKKSFNLENLK